MFSVMEEGQEWHIMKEGFFVMSGVSVFLSVCYLDVMMEKIPQPCMESSVEEQN